MKYEIRFDTTGSTELAQALRARVENPAPREATGFSYGGVDYKVDSEGVYLELKGMHTVISPAYRDIIKKITLHASLPPDEDPLIGPYRRKDTTAEVNSYVEMPSGKNVCTITVVGTSLNEINKLFSDIRAGNARARAAHYKQ